MKLFAAFPLRHLVCFAAFLLFFPAAGLRSEEVVCGNLDPNEDPCEDPCECDPPTGGGISHFHLNNGNVVRTVRDLVVNGAVGRQVPFVFERTTTSRYEVAVPVPFGSGGSWRHNWYWHVIPRGNNAGGREIIEVHYPDGQKRGFDKKTVGDLFLTTSSKTQERIEQSGADANQYHLIFPDGRKVAFRKLGTGAQTRFEVQGIYDSHGLFFAFTLDTKGRVTRVTEPAGRWINISYGSIGNFQRADVRFGLPNTTATSVTVAGTFNGWQTGANPLVNDGQGNWSAVVPLQLGEHHYKFFVNGTTWVADPNNPEHFPAGNNQNNSVMRVTKANEDAHLDAAAPVPVDFTFTSDTATSVAVAGSFNNWSASTHQFTREGSTWRTRITLPQGKHLYKLVVNNTQWMQDPANSFREPDGYGQYNSSLAVGPLDEAVIQVSTSTGLSVRYAYETHTVGATLYSRLMRANYGDNTQAKYTYTSPFNAGRPLLESADDPRYPGAAKRVAYGYQRMGQVEGFIHQEKSFVTRTPVVTLEAANNNSRRLVQGSGAVEEITLANGRLTSRKQAGTIGVEKRASYQDGGIGMQGSMTTMVDGVERTTVYERTWHFGVIKKTTHPDNKFHAVTFTDENRPFFVASKTDEMGRVTNYARDGRGRVTRIDFPALADGTRPYESWTYNDQTNAADNNNGFGQMATHRQRNGGVESFIYDVRGLMVRHTDAENAVTSFIYDAQDRVASVKNGRFYTTSYTYNERGLQTRLTHHDTKFRAFTYDAYGNQESVTNELSKTWTYTYDEYNRLWKATDPLQRTTEYGYGVGPSGCGSCHIEARPTSITLFSGRRTTFTYDDAWRRTSQTAGAGTADAATTFYTYDGAGSLLTISDPRDPTGAAKAWVFEYDLRGRRMAATDRLNQRTTWTHDDAGNVKVEKRPSETVGTRHFYDALNRRTSTVDQKDQTTSYAYDEANNLLTLTDARSKPYRFEYDNRNRRTKMVYPSDNSFEQWTYDAVGNVQNYRTRAGQVQTRSYDDRNRDMGYNWSDDTPDVSRTYDAANRLVSHNNANANLTYDYDAAGQLISETQEIIGGPSPKTVAYAHNADGRRSKLTYPGGEVTYTYTARNQVKEVTADGPPPLASYSYDLAGNLANRTLENGTTADYTYDAGGRLTSVNHQRSGVALATFAYSINSLGNRTAVTREDGKGDAYIYDAADQLTSVQYDASNPAGAPVNPAKTQGFVYDESGNRTSVTENGVPVTYSPSNSLNQYTSVGSSTLAYDANGNLVSAGAGTNFGYDAMNRLIAASAPSNSLAVSYDALNRAVKRVVNGVSIYFVYDGLNIVAEFGGGAVPTARYVHGPKIDEILARLDAGGATLFYHHDGLGSTVVLTDATGAPVERYRYDAFGAPRISNGLGTPRPSNTSAYQNRFLFTGRDWLAEVGLYDYRNRAYIPSLGRFLQTDPVQFAGKAINLYTYVLNQPTQLTDPLGLCCPKQVASDAAGRDECYDAVYEAGNEQLNRLEIIYNNQVNATNKDAAERSAACATDYDTEDQYYYEKKLACELRISSVQTGLIVAAYATFKLGRFAIGLAIQGGLDSCNVSYPCANGVESEPPYPWPI